MGSKLSTAARAAFLAAATGVLALGAISAQAATTTSTFGVGATVVSSATVSATSLAFGNYDPASLNALDGSSTITVNATTGGSYTIALNDGVNASGNQRRMKENASSNFLNYNLFQDISHTLAWGSSAGSTVSGTGTGAAIQHTVYGRIPAQQIVPVGVYNDTVTVTVTF